MCLLDLGDDVLQYLLTLGSGMWCSGYPFVGNATLLRVTCVRMQTVCDIFELRRFHAVECVYGCVRVARLASE